MNGIQIKTVDLLDKYYELSNRTTKLEDQIKIIKQQT